MPKIRLLVLLSVALTILVVWPSAAFLGNEWKIGGTKLPCAVGCGHKGAINLGFASDALHTFVFKGTTDAVGEQGKAAADYAIKKLDRLLSEKLGDLQKAAEKQRTEFMQEITATIDGSLEELDAVLQAKLEELDRIANRTMQQLASSMKLQQVELLWTLQVAAASICVMVLMLVAVWMVLRAYSTRKRGGKFWRVIKPTVLPSAGAIAVAIFLFAGTSMYYTRLFNEKKETLIVRFLNEGVAKHDVEEMTVAARLFAVLEPESDITTFMDSKSTAGRRLNYLLIKAPHDAAETMSIINRGQRAAARICGTGIVHEGGSDKCYDIDLALWQLAVLSAQSRDLLSDFYIASTAHNILYYDADKLSTQQRIQLAKYIIPVALDQPDEGIWEAAATEDFLAGLFKEAACQTVDQNAYALCTFPESGVPFGWSTYAGLQDFIQTLPQNDADMSAAYQYAKAVQGAVIARNAIETLYVGILFSQLEAAYAARLQPAEFPFAQFAWGSPTKIKSGLWEGYLEALKTISMLEGRMPRPDPVLIGIVADLKTATPYGSTDPTNRCMESGVIEDWMKAATLDKKFAGVAAMRVTIEVDCAAVLNELTALRADMMSVLFGSSTAVNGKFSHVPKQKPLKLPPADLVALLDCYKGGCLFAGKYGTKEVQRTYFSDVRVDGSRSQAVIDRLVELGIEVDRKDINKLMFQFVGSPVPFGIPEEPEIRAHSAFLDWVEWTKHLQILNGAAKPSDDALTFYMKARTL